MTSINQYGSSGSSNILSSAISKLNLEYQALEAETASGIVSSSYAGLGSSASVVLNLQPQITQTAAWSSNVTTAQTTLSVTQTIMDSISSIASSLTSTLTTLSSTVSSSTVETAAEAATDALKSLSSLLNTKSGDTYIFAGQDSETAPLSGSGDLSTSALASSIAAVVGNLDSDGADSVLSQTLDLAENTTAGSPFSAALSVDATTASTLESSVSVGQGTTISVGMVATEGTAATDTSTGSAIRDLIRNLMVVASLGSADTSSSEYTSLISSLTSSNSSVVSELADEEGSLGVTQNTLSARSSVLSQISTSLTTQLGTAQDADLSTVSTQLSDVQTQIEAAYTLISDLKGMTLADYL